jgi:hypothetical protein
MEPQFSEVDALEQARRGIARAMGALLRQQCATQGLVDGGYDARQALDLLETTRRSERWPCGGASRFSHICRPNRV